MSLHVRERKRDLAVFHKGGWGGSVRSAVAMRMKGSERDGTSRRKMARGMLVAPLDTHEMSHAIGRSSEMGCTWSCGTVPNGANAEDDDPRSPNECVMFREVKGSVREGVYRSWKWDVDG